MDTANANNIGFQHPSQSGPSVLNEHHDEGEDNVSRAPKGRSSIVEDPSQSEASSTQLSPLQVNTDVVIPIENEQSDLLSDNFKHIQTYMCFVNFASVRDYLQWLPGWWSLTLLRAFARVQKVLWLFTVILASVNGFFFVKDTILQLNGRETKRTTYIVMGLVFSQLFLTWNYLRNMVFNTKKIRKFFESLDYKAVENSNQSIYSKISWSATCLYILSFLLASVVCVLGIGVVQISSWSFELIVEVHYNEIYFGFTKWTTAESNATLTSATGTATDVEIHTEYMGTFASIGFISDLAIFLIVFCIGDIFVLVTCLLKKEVVELNALIQHYEQNRGGSNSQVLCTNIFTFYKCIFDFSKQLNSVFGPTIKNMHAYNLFLTVYLLHTLVSAGDIGSTFILLLKLSRCMIGYYNAVKISKLMEPFRRFLQDKENQQLLCIDALAYAVIKDELKAHPIGIGRDSFYVNEKFMRQFLITAVTFFFILIDEGTLSRLY